MPTEYEKAHATYAAAALKARQSGKPEDRADKTKAFQDMHAIEREARKAGTLLEGGKKILQSDSKRSLQEAYVRGFDDTEVELTVRKPDGSSEKQRTTLQKFHGKRLGVGAGA